MPKKLPENYDGPMPPKGVTWCEDRKKWLVRSRPKGPLKNQGYFENILDAIEINEQQRKFTKIRKAIERKEKLKAKVIRT